ncbi:flagellar hook assembly protein FlgD [Niveispirillum irakense]|uniref:flagellar hook assembly protein FlgD n=1 Tax=Niveispirillum irakense TaxID=34011 RepID=UPI00042007DA|nr:flagellar hook assembly protein FlgD [Niveispirillum irakense]
MTTVSGVDSNVATDAASQAAQTRLTTDTQSFLKLLTAQLSNQDPMQPVDPTQWVAQLAQFSTVEQAVTSNSRLAEVLTELRSTGDRMDLSYIGRSVEVAGDRVALKDGKLDATYNVPDGAAKVDISIVNNEGRVLRSFTGEKVAGLHALSWDGKDTEGALMSDGTYTVKVVATDEAGKGLTTDVYQSSKVVRITRDDGATLFRLENGLTVERDRIVSAA